MVSASNGKEKGYKNIDTGKFLVTKSKHFSYKR